MSKKKDDKHKYLDSDNIAQNYFTQVILGLTLFSLLFPPIFRGLFFDYEMFIAHIITALLLILVCVDKYQRKEKAYFKTPLEWAVLAFTLTYLISLLGAIQPEDAIYGFLRTLNYLVVFVIITQMACTNREVKLYMQALFIAGVLVAFSGISGALGFFDITMFNGKAIITSLQYPNTAAIYLGVTIFIGVALWINENKWLWKLGYSLSGFFMFLVILSTLSKGAWLALLIGGLILVIGLSKHYRIYAIYYLGLCFFAALATFPLFYPAILSSQMVTGCFSLLIGIIVVFGGELLFKRVSLDNKKINRLWIGSIAGVLAVTIFISSFNKAIWKNLKVEFIALTNLQSMSYTSRLDFWNWAWAIMKDYPIIGTGVGGWEALYHQYQHYLVWTEDAHNCYLQIGLDTGFLGLAAFLTIIIVFAWLVIRLKKESNNQDWLKVWTLFTATVCLLGHSLIDFNLSIPAVSILLFSLLALVNALFRINIRERVSVKHLPGSLILAFFMAAFLLIPAGSFLIAQNKAQMASEDFNRYIKQAESTLTPEQYQQIYNLSADAVVFNPVNAEYRANLAYIKSIDYVSRLRTSKPTGNRLHEIEQQIAWAERFRPADNDVRNKILTTGVLLNDHGIVLHQLDMIIHYNPNNTDGYIVMANTLWNLLQMEISQNNHKQVKYYAQQLIDLDERMKNQQSQIDISYKQWKGKRLLWPNEQQKMIIQAYDILKR